MQHVLILGAGALGSLFGARLSRAREKVTLFSTNQEHIQAIRENGLEVEELDGSVQRYALVACDDPGTIDTKADLVIVLVKSYTTREAVEGIKSCCRPSTLFLTLQNGTGNWERIAGVVGKESVLVGVTAQGATRLQRPGCIRHGGNGATFIGEPEGPSSERARWVVDLFRRSGIETEASDRMKELMWEKLMINVGINAITALTGIRNGLIPRVEEGRELCRAAVEEAMLVARAQGITIREDMVERVLSVAVATSVNRSSMGQDADRRKRTEIDAINGAIVRLGREAHIETPVNRTLTHLIKIMEAGHVEGMAR